MAVACSNCRRSDGGKRRYVYLQHFVSDEMERTRARLCEACYAGLLADYLAVCERQSPRGDWLTQEQQS